MSNGKAGFFNTVLSPGSICLITATMRAGKSNLASYLMEKAIPLGFYIYTNLLFYSMNELKDAIGEGILKQKESYYRRVPPEVNTKTRMSELILGLNSTAKNLSILDEALLYASSKKGATKDMRWFEGYITQSGKFRTATVLIAQAKSKLATLVKQDLPTYELKVFKVSDDNRYVEIWFNPPDDKSGFEEPYKLDTWYNIPATKYPYDTFAPAGFEFDIDMERFINRISKMKTLEVRKKIPDIIQEMQEDREEKNRKKKTVKQSIIEIIQEKPELKNDAIMRFLKEIGLKCSESYINKIRKEMGIYLD